MEAPELHIDLFQILDASSEKIFCVNKEHKLIYANKAFLQFAEVFGNPALGSPMYPMQKQQKEAWEMYYAKALLGEGIEIEYSYKDNNQQNRTESIVFQGLINQRGVIDFCVVTAKDITKYKEAEKSRTELDRRYSLLFEKSLAGVFITTLSGEFIDCNHAFARILGYSNREEILEKKVLNIYFTAQDREQYINKLLASGYLSNYESRHKRKNGQEVWILANVSLGYDQEEQPAFIEGTFIDITDLKTAGEKLVEREDRFRKISQIISDYAYEVKLNRKTAVSEVIWLLGAYEGITGFNEQELHKHGGFEQLIHPQDREKLVLTDQMIVDGKYDLTYRIINKNGQERWIRDVAEFTEITTEYIRMVGAVTEVTTQTILRESEEKNQQSLRRLLNDLPIVVIIMSQKEILYLNASAAAFMNTIACENHTHLLRFIGEETNKNVLKQIHQKEPFSSVPMEIETQNNRNYYTLEGMSVDFSGVNAYCLLLSDVTTKYQLVDEMTRSKAMLEMNEKLQLEISLHKATQQQLKDVQRFAKYIIESSIDMIIASDVYGGITEINHAALRRFGYALPEVLGKTPNVLYASQDEYDYVFEALNNKGFYRGEVTNVTRSGELFTSTLSASLIKNERGEIVGAMGLSRDITNLKKSEKQLIEQASLITALTETSSTLIWTIDRKYRLMSFNQIFETEMDRLFGIRVKRGDSFLKLASALVSQKDRYDVMISHFERSLNGVAEEFEGPLRTINGATQWYEIFLNPVILDNHEWDEVVCLAHDITEKKKVQKQLYLNEQRIKAMVQAIPDSILRVDSEGVIAEGRWFNFNGHQEVINTGATLLDVFGRDSESKLQKKIEESLKMNSVVNYEFILDNNDGDIATLEVRVSPITDKEVLMMVRNVTQEKKAEQQIRESLKEKEVLLKEVHHRVKNNLQIISSILNLQCSYVRDTQTLNILRESQNRIKSMSYIHELLYQNKQFSSIRFSDYLLNLATSLIASYQVSDTKIDVVYDIKPVDLTLDQAIPCGLIVNEIITNSLKYAFDNRTEGKLFVELKLKNNLVALRIADDGVGLPNNIDFRQTESLGLQLVVTLVEQLDGTIVKEEIAGTGYLITFENQNTYPHA